MLAGEAMSFRRKRDEWDEFLKRYSSELRECGVPDEVTRDRGRFLRFLDHGFDQDGWYNSRPCSPWSIDMLTVEQANRLAEFITEHFGEEQYRDFLRELRRQAGGWGV
jgi:hypothetical protein